MPENSIHSQLRRSFPPSDKDKWKQAASQEIEGKDPFGELSWENADQLKFFPYYDFSDVAHQQNNFALSPSRDEDSFFGPRKWLNAPPVHDMQAEKSNHAALDHLSQGADAIFFTQSKNFSPEILLKSIEWSFCSLFFNLSEGSSLANELSAYIAKNKISSDAVRGSFFWESIPRKSVIDFYLNNTKNFNCLGFTIQASTPANEIAEALRKGVTCIEQLQSEGVQTDKIFSAIAFSVPVNTDFAGTIAKLKALRQLWYQVARAYGQAHYHHSDLHIHARSESWNAKAFEPHSNLLKSTTAAMASVCGGCNSLTIMPQDENNPMLHRISRNVSSILREEAHFNKVADPIAGAYALEIMTQEIAKKAWNIFQTSMV